MTVTFREGSSFSVVIVIALVVTILVSVIAAFEYSQTANLRSQNEHLQTENQDLSAQIPNASINSSRLSEAWLSHIYKLENINITGALEDFEPNATMMWSGTTQGLGGRYVGVDNIKPVFKAFFLHTDTLYFVIQSFNSTTYANGTGDVKAVASFYGESKSIGPYNGTISANDQYSYQNGNWVISREMWVFSNFITDYPVQIF